MVHLDADLTDPDGYNKVHPEHSLGVNRNVCPYSVPYPGTGWLLLPSSHTSPHIPPDNGHRSAHGFFQYLLSLIFCEITHHRPLKCQATKGSIPGGQVIIDKIPAVGYLPDRAKMARQEGFPHDHFFPAYHRQPQTTEIPPRPPLYERGELTISSLWQSLPAGRQGRLGGILGRYSFQKYKGNRIGQSIWDQSLHFPQLVRELADDGDHVF